MEDTTWEPWVSAAVNSLQNLGLSRGGLAGSSRISGDPLIPTTPPRFSSSRCAVVFLWGCSVLLK